jgi:hypothetical protein
MELNCDRRISSTGSPQSLMLMNGDFVLKEAEAFARRLLKEAPLVRPLPAPVDASSTAKAWEPQLTHAWQLAFQRPITVAESTLSSRFLQQQVEHLRETKSKDPARAALVDLCQQLLCANEFLYVD